MYRFFILACLLTLMACAGGLVQNLDAPTVCSIRVNPERYAGQEVTIRAVHLTDYSESASLGDVSCPRTALALAGGSPAIGNEAWMHAHCSVRIEQGDLVALTARGIVQYDPNEAIATRFRVIEARDIGYVPGGPFLANAVRDPRSRQWLCPNLLEAQ